MYQHPGVYIEEVPSGSAPIEGASTSVALIVGYATKGPPSNPTLLFNFDQYSQQFGGIVDFYGSTVGQTVDYMGHTVQAFFNNGGTQAYIVRLEGSGAGSATGRLVVPVPGATASASFHYCVVFTALNSGGWANGLVVNAVPTGAAPVRYTVSVGTMDRLNNFVTSEVYTDVSLDPADGADYAATKINGISSLVTVAATLSAIAAADELPAEIGTLISADLTSLGSAAITALDKKGFIITFHTGPGVPIALVTPTSLVDVAQQIQTQGRAGAVALSPAAGFTCTIENMRLVLRSGVPDPAASIALSAPTATGITTGIAALKLDPTATGANKATSYTGDQAFAQKFNSSSSATLAGGVNGGLPTQTDYDGLLPQLKKIRDISIIMLPGQTWSAADAPGMGIISSLVGHAELMGNRMVIIDPAPGKQFNTSLQFNAEGFPTSTYTAAYYPWLEVANPWYEPDLRPNRSRTLMIPPSGFAAGLWAKTDAKRGVWKAPAGLQASLLGAANTQYTVGDDEQDQLNPVGLNCYRRIISDIVIWGGRTLATKADPEWRYVPVRRTAMMIEESVYDGIQWAVFEPNDHRLWSSLRLNIGALMESLYRAGAFQGEKSSDAYFVRCGLGDTMTQGDIDAGQVIVLVGFAPLKPAEFVVVKIQQIVGQS